MNLWYKKSSLFVLAGVSYVVGQYFRGVWFQHFSINTCRYAVDSWGTFCNSPYLSQGYAFILLGEYLAIIAIIMLFTNAVIFHRWLRFSLYYVPIAVVLTFWMYPTTTPLGGVVPISQGVRLFGWLYIIITVAIIFVSWVRVWMKGRTSTEKVQ